MVSTTCLLLQPFESFSVDAVMGYRRCVLAGAKLFRQSVRLLDTTVTAAPKELVLLARATKCLAVYDAIHAFSKGINQAERISASESMQQAVKHTTQSFFFFVKMARKSFDVLDGLKELGAVSRGRFAWIASIVPLLFPFTIIRTATAIHRYKIQCAESQELISLLTVLPLSNRRVEVLSESLSSVAQNAGRIEKMLDLKLSLENLVKSERVQVVNNDNDAIVRAEAVLGNIKKQICIVSYLDGIALICRVVANINTAVALFIRTGSPVLLVAVATSLAAAELLMIRSACIGTNLLGVVNDTK